jgi:hypothetical protein
MPRARFVGASASGLMRLLLAGAAVAACGESVSAAEGCPPIVFGAPHDSLDELVETTLQELFEAGGRYESGGFVVRQGGAYYASTPVTQQQRRAVNYCIVLPRGARLAALYHTHVFSAEPSPRDRSNAERAGVPSYVGALRDRSILVYDGQRRDLRAMERPPGMSAARADSTTPVATEHVAPPDDAPRSALGDLRRRAAALVEKLANLL